MIAHRRVARIIGPTVMALATVALSACHPALRGVRERPAFEEHRVAGGPGDFLEALHLVLRGSNDDIGHALGVFAATRLGSQPRPAGSPASVRSQLDYFDARYPAFAERVRGVARSRGASVAAGDVFHSTLTYDLTRPGCTVFHLPPSAAFPGGVMSRNYDFSTGTLRGRRPADGQRAATSRPIVLELHPDEGYASIALCAYDLLGAIDGINSEGLAVALLADDEIIARYGVNPATEPGPGLSELQVVRFLLDTCANAAEARAALAATPLYYLGIPCHYMIADRHGDAFIWENDRSMEHGYVFEASGAPLVSTNFMWHLHAGAALLPEDGPSGSFSRYQTVKERLAATGTPLSSADVCAIARCVAATNPADGDRPPGRTLWHALYDPARREVKVSFYLGEGTGGVRRSDDRLFALRTRVHGQ